VLIKRILEITGKSTLLEVWPRLEMYLHGGISFTPYKKQFEKLIGGKINYLNMYNASEGFFAAQNDTSDDMLLFLQHGIFYEFMPVEEYGKPNPQTIGLKAVELNKNYAPVISTNGGLWRYLIGDTISFTSLYPFKIKVTGRLKHFINAFGEELIVDNSDQAISKASAKTGAVVKDYTAAPVYFTDTTNGAHEWLIEFEKEPEDLKKFIVALDASLKSLNSDYEAKRYKNIAMKMPLVHPATKGLFNEWLHQKGKMGGQHKVPRLSNDRKYMDELLVIWKEKFG
ncbi:MAG: GH3 auxin-responsive promoter family protein, partial [Chitinophagaceae bacterium]